MKTAKQENIQKLPISGILLAGGKSSRMGSDKSFIEINGKALISYSIDLLNEVCDEVLISANSDKYNHFSYPIVKDKASNGPISGLLACLPLIKNNFALVIPTDVPYFSLHLIKHLIEQKDEHRITVAFNNNMQMEPLCAIYPKAQADNIIELAKRGERKMFRVIEELGYKKVLIHKELPFYNENIFHNINRPRDLK